MPRPTNLEILDEALNEIEEGTELPIGKKKALKIRVTHSAVRRSGMIVRHFVKIDGVPIATITPITDDAPAGATLVKDAQIRAVRGKAQSIRVLAWERNAPPADARDVASRRVRIKGKT